MLPPGTRHATLWLDESGSRTTGGRLFVVAGIKTRNPDALQRDIMSVRQELSYEGEFKLTRASRESLARFYKLIEVLEASDAKIIGTVVDRSAYDPFKNTHPWEAQAKVMTGLVIGNLATNELGTVLVDGISTPAGVAMGTHIKRGVNGVGSCGIVTCALSLNSKTNDLLQVADLVAGSIADLRTSRSRADGDKAKIARRLAREFELDERCGDQRGRRVNIRTLTGPPRKRSRKPELRVIEGRANAS